MTKSKHQQNEPEFYESLPLSATPPGGFSSQAWNANPDTVKLPFTREQLITASEYTVAATRDLGHYSAKAVHPLLGRKALVAIVSLMILAGVTAGSVAVVAARQTLNRYTNYIASPIALLNKNNSGTTITDRKGTVLYEGYGATTHNQVPINQLPQNLTNATLAAEDPGFYSHAGFSWKGTLRALYMDVKAGGSVQGGSTITQQLIKNTLLKPEKSYQRKFQEVILASALEQRYSKRDILGMYLNKVYYGQGSYGVDAAAETYFHKPAAQLSLSESAMLAGLPLGPSRYDPTLDLEASTERRNYILSQMANEGFITRSEAERASQETLTVYPHESAIKAPHFVFYVLDQLRAQYGDDLVEHGGITVRTSLDLDKQTAAEKIVAAQVDHLASHHATNGGLISLDPKTGDVLAMVGSKDYYAPGFGSVNVTTSHLQPGSSFKPFAYATAFKKGWNGATVIDDKPMSLPNGDGTQYVPQNYDGKFRNRVTLRRALSNSLNIPALHVMQFAGLAETINTAQSLGITTLGDASNYGLSLVLGSGEVRPLDMAAAYGAFATGGMKVTPRPILAVLDRTNHDITVANPDRPQVLDPKIAFMITNILSDNTARSEEFGPNSPLKLSRPAAAKTGTTNDFRDNWTVGYTPDMVTAVWVGNNDHSAMSNVDGITGAAPIWHDYMEQALAGRPVTDFVPPAGLTNALVCSQDGGLANPWDSNKFAEWFILGTAPTKPCASTKPADPVAPTPTDTPAPTPATNQPVPVTLRIIRGHRTG
jgi:1A family penicillin-binding protein